MPPASCTAPPPPSAPAGAGMGQIAGYTAADYLIQHASRERRYARVPASTWDAALSHIRDPADTARLADSARDRLLYRYAIPLYRHAADAGDRRAAGQLAELLADRGDLDGVCAPGPTPATGLPPGGWPSCWPSAATWTEPARPGPTPATGTAAWRLADCWPSGATWTRRRSARPGRRRRRVRRRVAGRAAGRARRPGRAARPGRRRRRGCRRAAGRAAGRARRPGRGRADAARRADAGDRYAASRLAELLAERGDLDGAESAARRGRRRRPGRRRGGWPSCWPSAATWTDCAPGPTPATRLPPSSWRAAGRARRPGRAARPGRRRRPDAASRLAGLLAEHGDLDGPSSAARRGRRRRRGCRLRAGRAAGRARRPGRAARPGRRRRPATPPRGWLSCWPSAATWTELRARADAGDRDAARRLAELLAERGDLDGLRARADAGDRYAARRLAGLLAERGDLDELRARADTGDRDAALRLADLLMKQGREKKRSGCAGSA